MFLRDVRRILALPAAGGPAQREDVQTARRESITITKLLFNTEPGIKLPALLFEPNKSDPSRPLVVCIPGDGKAKHAAPGGWVEEKVGEGSAVLIVDLRGMGELAPPPVDWARTCGDLHEALLAIYLNRPLLGQRVYDLIAVIERMAPLSTSGIHLVGTGAAGPIALHAAALDSRVTELTLEGSIVSWSDVVRTPMNYDQLTNVVPGALKDYDLPDLAAAIAPRPLTIRGPVFPLGKVMSLEVAKKAYASCASAYEAQGVEKRLKFRSDQE
jgi:hypothetical protein